MVLKMDGICMCGEIVEDVWLGSCLLPKQVQVTESENWIWVLGLLKGDQACLLEEIRTTTRNIEWV